MAKTSKNAKKVENPYRVGSEAGEEPTEPQNEVLDFLILVAFTALAAYGAIRICEDFGVITSRDGRAEFWFEEELRKWIRWIGLLSCD